jgi:hypothetical protein
MFFDRDIQARGTGSGGGLIKRIVLSCSRHARAIVREISASSRNGVGQRAGGNVVLHHSGTVDVKRMKARRRVDLKCVSSASH